MGDFMKSLHGDKGDKGDQGANGSDGSKGAQGAQGAQGTQGQQGAPGQSGKDAYQVWLDAGNTGTRGDFIQSLKGAKGDSGTANLTIAQATVSSTDGTADITCPTGMIATGGGGNASSGSMLVENSPKTNGNGKAIGWHIKDNSNGNKSKTIFALCAPDA